jgi:DNA-binding LacI/PurR family transcriptional regulator
MAVTIKDVAKLAGVSISTISLALNNQPGVKDETRQRVLDAVKKLNYRPNQMAQGLVKKKTNNINVVVSGPKYGYFSSPILFEEIKGIAEIINSSGYRLVLKMTTAEEEIEFIEEQMDARTGDGMILWGSRMSEERLEEIGGGPMPVVVIGRYLKHKELYSVTVNDYKGAYLGTRHLLELGHVKIGFIGSLYGVSSAQDRLEGYKEALREFGLDIDKNLVVRGDYYQESGYNAMKEILPYFHKGMTAVFAASDLMALGAIKAILEQGLSVPDDISIVGFDNMPNSDLLLIPLTTVATPLHKLGEEAARKLISLLNKEPAELQTQLDVELLVRKSTRRRN